MIHGPGSEQVDPSPCKGFYDSEGSTIYLAMLVSVGPCMKHRWPLAPQSQPPGRQRRLTAKKEKKKASIYLRSILWYEVYIREGAPRLILGYIT